MKNKISIDFAILSSILSIFLFTCGYFYLDSYTHFFGFNQAALGFSFQDYLIFGWVNNLLTLFFIFITFLTISLVNTLQEQDLYESISKIILGIFIFIGLILWKLISKIWFYIVFFILTSISNYFFIILFLPLKIILIFLLRVIFSIAMYLFNKLKPQILPLLQQAKSAINWHENKDDENLKKSQKIFSYHYVYLVLFYIFFLSAVFYIIYVGKLGKNQAIKDFSSPSSQRVIIKNELMDDWITKNNFNVNYPISAKLLLCGSEKCLVGIPTLSIKNSKFESISTFNNYYFMTISPDQYIILK